MEYPETLPMYIVDRLRADDAARGVEEYPFSHLSHGKESIDEAQV